MATGDKGCFLGFHRSVLIFHSCSEADLHFLFFSLATIFVITTVAIVTKCHSHLISQCLCCIYTSSYATTSDYSTNHDVTACQRLSVSHFPKKEAICELLKYSTYPFQEPILRVFPGATSCANYWITQDPDRKQMVHSNGLIKESLIRSVYRDKKNQNQQELVKHPRASKGWELLLTLRMNFTLLSSSDLLVSPAGQTQPR